jgi:hypothetical protein
VLRRETPASRAGRSNGSVPTQNLVETMRLLVMVWLACSIGAGATNYYVSSSGGNDANDGKSPATAWKTFSAAGNHVNSGSFNAGDVIYLKRGDVWNEQLVPPSSGASGNPIQFDAYGTGAAPLITAAAPILPWTSGTGTPWMFIAANTWKATVTTGISSGTLNMVKFGNVWGRKQSNQSGCPNSIVSKYDWCVSWPYLYVYSPPSTNPVVTYAADGSIVPIVAQASGLAMISVANKNWLVFQHIEIQNFDYMGVGVTGSSDNLVFANMESDGMVPGMVPYGATPHGFYVNVPNAQSIQFVNDDAHLNYDGFKISGAGRVECDTDELPGICQPGRGVARYDRK